MDIDDSVIGSSCQDYKPFLPLKSVPKPGQIQPVLPRQPKMVFPFLTIPFIEAGCRHDTSPLQQGSAEHRFISAVSPRALMMTLLPLNLEKLQAIGLGDIFCPSGSRIGEALVFLNFMMMI